MSVSTHTRRDQIWIGAGLYTYLGITLAVPLLVIFLWTIYDPAVGWFPPDIVPSSYSVSAWREVLADRQIIPSGVLSIIIAVIVTTATGILAFPTAWALAQFPFRLKRAVEVFVLAPLIVPGIVVAQGGRVGLRDQVAPQAIHDDGDDAAGGAGSVDGAHASVPLRAKWKMS
jgi:multiple sugar transport system permease protein/putative spermidine/putrescine transport system permease protein